MELTKESSPAGTMVHGHTVVGATAVPLAPAGQPALLRGIEFRCPGPLETNGNTDIVWVGNKNVTADSGPAGGMPILPGTGGFLPLQDPSQVYVISASEGQDIAWLGV